ncbi:hypothetical protein EJB05_02546, partial [Eragrostis curvula]
MEVSLEAGNAGDADWRDDDGRPRRTGTLGWGRPGPTAMLLFAFVTYYIHRQPSSRVLPHRRPGDREEKLP